MKIPKGFKINEGLNDEYVLEIKRNIYGQVNAGRVWNDYLTDRLVNKLGFKQSKVDKCMFYRGKTMYLLYTDDSILAGPDKNEIDKIISDIRGAGLDITEEGDIQDFLGVNITRNEDGTILLHQPHLVDEILHDLWLTNDKVSTKRIPMASSRLLTYHADSPSFDRSFDYRSVIGKMLYLEKGSRSDITYTVHQCARFTADPKKEHGEAVKWLGRYLKLTRDKGLILRPDETRGLEVYVDASFASDWDLVMSHKNRTARSRHGYIIYYAGCPVLTKSQFQTEIALSTTESEYTGASYTLRDAIPIMEMLKEFKRNGFKVIGTKADVKCKVFEDNSSALEMMKIDKYCPRTKHLCCRLHHFRSYVDDGQITMHKVDTYDQDADMLTKPVNEEILLKCRKRVWGGKCD